MFKTAFKIGLDLANHKQAGGQRSSLQLQYVDSLPATKYKTTVNKLIIS